MTGTKRIVSVFLLLVFLFPVAYQAHHILTRHVDFERHSNHSHCCRVGDEPIKDDGAPAISSPEESCLVVEFEYTHYNLHNGFISKTDKFSPCEYTAILEDTFIPFFNGNDRLLRAPPAIA